MRHIIKTYCLINPITQVGSIKYPRSILYDIMGANLNDRFDIIGAQPREMYKYMKPVQFYTGFIF